MIPNPRIRNIEYRIKNNKPRYVIRQPGGIYGNNQQLILSFFYVSMAKRLLIYDKNR
jgi:hypothetical protein